MCTLGTAKVHLDFAKISFHFHFLETGVTMKMALEILSKKMVNIGWVTGIFTY